MTLDEIQQALISNQLVLVEIKGTHVRDVGTTDVSYISVETQRQRADRVQEEQPVVRYFFAEKQLQVYYLF